MNKDLPDILQKWHEVSTLLRKNQTTTNIRLNEIERTTEKLRMNLTKYKNNLESQQTFAKEEKIVAAFGAKIEAAITDMESFKDYYSRVINKQIEMKTTLNDLRKLVAQRFYDKIAEKTPTKRTSNGTKMRLNQPQAIYQSTERRVR